MSLGLAKSSSFKGQGRPDSGLSSVHSQGCKPRECADFPPTLRRSPSAAITRERDPWIKFLGDWGNADYTFRVNDHIRCVKDGRLSVVAALYRKRPADFKVSRVAVEGDLLSFRIELPGTVIDWHLRKQPDGLTGTMHNHHTSKIHSIQLERQGWLSAVRQEKLIQRELVRRSGLGGECIGHLAVHPADRA